MENSNRIFYYRCEILFVYLFMFLNALSVNILGPIMPHLQADYCIDKAQASLLLTFQSAGGILAILLGGVLSTLLRKHTIAVLALILYALCMMALLAPTKYATLLLLFFFMGSGMRLLDMVLNAYNGDLCTKNRGFFMGMFHATFGIGALAGPIYISLILRRFYWRIGFFITGAIFIVLYLLYELFLKLQVGNFRPSELAPVRVKSKSDLLSVLKSPIIWCFVGIMFVYMGYQYGVMTWSPSYMFEHFNMSDEVGSLIVTIFWIGVTISRIVSGKLSTHFSIIKILAFTALAASIALTSGILLDTPFSVLCGFGISGLLVGGCIPLLMAYAFNRFPNYTGVISSILFAASAAGIMLCPYIIGYLAELIGFTVGMLFNSIILLLIPIFCTIASVSSKPCTRE